MGMSTAQKQFYDQVQIYYQTVGILGLFGAFMVVLTGFLFRPLRREIFFQLILCASFCDVLLNLSMAWGDDVNQEMCTIQAFCQVYFLLASILFVCMICFTMFSHVSFQKQYLHFWHMVAISLGVSLFLALIPLSNQHMTYVATREHDMGIRCFLSVKNVGDDDAMIDREERIHGDWVNAVYLYPMMSLTGLMALLCTWLYVYTLPAMDSKKADRILPLVNYIMMYPVLMIILYLPSAIFWAVEPREYGPNDTMRMTSLDQARVILTGGRFLYGFFAAIVFFTNSSSAREFWRLWFIRNIGSRLCGYEAENPLLKGLTPQELRDSGIMTRTRNLTMIQNYTNTRMSGKTDNAKSIISVGGIDEERNMSDIIIDEIPDESEMSDLDKSLVATFVDPELEIEKMKQSRARRTSVIERLRSPSRTRTSTVTSRNTTTLSHVDHTQSESVENPLGAGNVAALLSTKKTEGDNEDTVLGNL